MYTTAGVNVLTVLLHWLRDTQLRERAFRADGQPVGAGRRAHSGESVGLDEACREILKGIARRRRELVIPWKLKALATVQALRPKWSEAIVRRAGFRPNRRAISSSTAVPLALSSAPGWIFPGVPRVESLSFPWPRWS